jgi:hypothetical protein
MAHTARKEDGIMAQQTFHHHRFGGRAAGTLRNAARGALWTACLTLVLCLPAAWSQAGQGAPVVFSAAGFDPEKIFVQFLGGAGKGIDGYFYNMKKNTMESLKINTAYTLADLTSPFSMGGAPAGTPAVFIKNYISGRIYISLGVPLTIPHDGYQPNSAKTDDPNYTVRYQYLEPTFDDGGVHVNMTYIDCLAIGMSLEAVHAPNARNNPLATTVDTTVLVTAAAAVAIRPNASVVPSPRQILPDPGFVRVLPPMATADSGVVNPLYHDWTHYLKTVLQNKQTRIEGCFAGSGDAKITPKERLSSQGYSYTATVDAQGDVTMTANKGSGAANSKCGGISGRGIGDKSTIRIDFADLNTVNGIYGCDVKYVWSYVDADGKTQSGSTEGLTNDVFGWVAGDLLAGLNFGFPGSAVTHDSIPIGGLSSTRWWGGILPDGTRIDPAATPAGKNLMYEKAQPGQPSNYNTYAAIIRNKTAAYGFSLQDRLGQTLLEFDPAMDPCGYLRVTLNPDTGK